MPSTPHSALSIPTCLLQHPPNLTPLSGRGGSGAGGGPRRLPQTPRRSVSPTFPRTVTPKYFVQALNLSLLSRKYHHALKGPRKETAMLLMASFSSSQTVSISSSSLSAQNFSDPLLDNHARAEPFVLSRFSAVPGARPKGLARLSGSARAPIALPLAALSHPEAHSPPNPFETSVDSPLEARIQALMEEGDKARTFLVALFTTTFFGEPVTHCRGNWCSTAGCFKRGAASGVRVRTLMPTTARLLPANPDFSGELVVLGGLSQ
jgi:hypothetical protein